MSKLSEADLKFNKTCEARLDSALKYRKQGDREKRWKMYRGLLGHNLQTNKAMQDTPVVERLTARVRAQPSKLALNDPDFQVTCYGKEPTPNSAAGWAGALALVWKQEGINSVQKAVTLDAPTYGAGYTYVGYERSETDAIINGRRKLFGLASAEFTEKVASIAPKATDALSTHETRTTSATSKHRAFVDRVSQLNAVMDPCAESWEDCEFVARRIFLPAEKGRQMFGKDCPKADSIANVALYTDETSSNLPSSEAQDMVLASLLDDAVKRIAVWEMWDITARKTIYLDGACKVIPNQVHDWRSPYPGFPMPRLAWDEMPETPYAEGMFAAGFTLAKEINEIRRREFAEAGKAFGKMLVPETLDPKAEAALTSANDGELVKIGDEAFDRIKYLERDAMPPEFWSLEDRAKADLDEVLMTSAYDAGGAPAVRQSATAASYSQSASDAVVSSRQMDVERWASDVADRIVAIMSSTFDEPMIVRITNADPDLKDEESGKPIEIGAEVDFNFIPVDHAGNWTCQVTSGSMAANAKAVEQAQKGAIADRYGAQPWFDSKAWALNEIAGIPSIRNPQQFIIDVPVPEPQPDVETPPLLPGGPMGMAGELPPDPFAGMAPPAPEADLAAAAQGAIAPMTGMNGMGGMGGMAI